MATEVKLKLTAKDETAIAFAKAQKNIDALKSSSLGLAASLGAGISVAGLVAFAKSAIDGLDALNDLSDATGASVENLSALEDVAARTGTSFDTVQSALVKFNSALNSAKKDSPQALAIEAIGLSVEKLKAEDPAEALRLTAVALAGFADDGNKARIVQELFGKSVREVAPLLKDLAESGKLVSTVTTEQAKEAEKFNQQLATLEKNIKDVSRSFASVLLPAISDTIQELRLGISTFGDFTSAIVLLGTTSTSNSLTENIKKYRDQVAEFEADRARYVNAKSDTRGIDDALNVAKKRLKYFTELRALQNLKYISPDDQLENESRRLGMSKNKPGLPGKTGGGNTGAAKQSEADRYLESLTKQLEKSQELSAVQQLGFDIIAKRVGKISVAEQNNLVQLAQKIDAIKSQSEAEKELAKAIKETSDAQEEFFAAVIKSDDAKQSQIEKLLSATPTANLESQRIDVQLLTAEFEAGRISETLYLEAVTSRLDLTGEKIQNTKTLADDLGLSFTSAFENAIVGGQNFSDVLAGLEQDILRIVTRKMVTEPLGNAITGAMSGFNPGKFLAGLFSADGGGYTGAGPRSGGLDGKGGFMAMLHPQETVVDHTKGQRSGNSVTVNISQSFAQGTSRQTTMQAAADASRQLQYAGRNL